VSEKPVERVLVIPVHETGFGAWAMPEGDPGATLELATIANAFIYSSGEAFQIKQPRSWGIVWLFLGSTGSAPPLGRCAAWRLDPEAASTSTGRTRTDKL
jgi:hypothetical protein